MYDVIIVGGGVAGLSASLFTAKAGLKTLVLDKGQSQIKRVSAVQNIPGFPEGISGVDWIANTRKQAAKFNVELKEENVLAAIKDENGWFGITGDQGTYQSRFLIIATNANEALITGFGLSLSSNRLIPSGKGKAVAMQNWNGETEVENLYLAGLITELPSQVSVVLGHGAAVGITVASKAKEQPFMWHDL